MNLCKWIGVWVRDGIRGGVHWPLGEQSASGMVGYYIGKIELSAWQVQET